MKKFEILEHTADLKIKVWGKDLGELFKNAATAMFTAMCGKSEIRNTKFETISKFKIRKLKTKKIEIKGQDLESLLVNFLNELLYLSDVENQGFKIKDLRFKNETELEAQLISFPLPPLEIEIKGATYHDLKIKKLDNIYEVVIVFDI